MFNDQKKYQMNFAILKMSYNILKGTMKRSNPYASKHFELYRKRVVRLMSITMKGMFKDYLWINNSIETKRIKSSNIESYLQSGWVLGRLYFERPKVQAITNGFENKRVLHDEVDFWLAQGWTKGKFKTNQIRVTDGKTNKQVNPNNIPEGFSPGSWLNTATGRKWVTNGKEDLYLKIGEECPAGFIPGRSLISGDKSINKKLPSCKNKISITDGISQRFILHTDPIPDGWNVGTKPKKPWKWSSTENHAKRKKEPSTPSSLFQP